MRNFVQLLLESVWSAFCVFLCKGCCLTESRLYLSIFRCSKDNQLTISKSKIEKSKFEVSGSHNSIMANQCLVANSLIEISGSSNQLVIDPDVQLRHGWIQIRGSGNLIHISNGTTTGGVRLVNTGRGINLTIGRSCVIADDVEIWASDTHSIVNQQGDLINPDANTTIEDGVWIGGHVRVLKGVRVGEGSIVGMSSVVTRNIPPHSLCAGIPAKVLKSDISWNLQSPSEYQNFKSHNKV